MGEDPKRVMANALTSVLEGMAFTFAETPGDEGLQTGDTEFVHATIEFSGQVSGQLGIAAPASLCAELTAGVLGEEPDDVASPAQLCDTLGELLNVTCGNFTTAMYGDTLVFEQSIPHVARMNKEAWDELCRHPEAQGFQVDGTPLVGHLSIRERRA